MSNFPRAPTDALDWDKDLAGLRVIDVNGHIESTYRKSTGRWTPLKFVADPYMRIHGMCPGLNYGQQILEGFKAFRMPGNPGNIALFRAERNGLRFQHSAEVLSMPIVPIDMFMTACRAVVALNADFVPPHESGGALYVRPQLYGSSAHLGLTAPEEYKFCVFCLPTAMYHGTSPIKALILDEFDRAAPHGTGHAKVGGNYAPVMKWSEKARLDGFGVTLHLDSARHEEVDEFSTCGFLAARHHGPAENDITLVVPDSPCIIKSVTSDSIQGIARSFGWNVEVRAVRYTELPEFEEVFGAGTAVSMTPVQSITRCVTHKKLSGSRVTRTETSETIVYLPESQAVGGPIYTRLLTQLKAVQFGKVKDEFGWRVELTAADQEVEGGSEERYINVSSPKS